MGRAGGIADRNCSLFIFREVLGLPHPETAHAPSQQPRTIPARELAFETALSWASRCRLKGLNEEAIAAKLLGAGWQESDIRELLDRMALYFE